MTASRVSSLAQWFQQIEQDIEQQADQKAGQKAALEASSNPIRELQPVSGDASFRRYFRVSTPRRSYILMDAPPEQESCVPFMRVAHILARVGVNVPSIYAVDETQGFMCLDDFGDTLLWRKLDQTQAAERGNQSAEPDAHSLYHAAFGELLKIQSAPVEGLPPYDKALLQREMELFRDWFCQRLLGLKLDARDNQLLDQVFARLSERALRQPRVCVHRDYHSRNLMYLPGGELGVLDFQDAVQGAVSYDLVSLLRDCYIAWPRQKVDAWALDYARLAHDQGVLEQLDPPAFLQDFHLMGMQRHLKAIGIFARLQLRDGKPAYLQHIPRTLSYVREVAAEHASLQAFGGWLEQQVLPDLARALQPGGGNGTQA